MPTEPRPIPLPAILARRLEELEHRLCQAPFRAGSSASVPAVFTRIELALRLLQAEWRPGSPTGLTDLMTAFGGLRQSLTDVPERNLAVLAAPWRQLARFLESLLGRLDQGEDPSLLLEDPGWEAVGARLALADGPLSVVGELHEGLEDWVRRWGDADLHPRQERELARSWERLRALGDSALLSGLLDGFADPTPPRKGP